MRFLIEHETRYDYSKAVFLEPHTIRLCPRSDPAQRLIDFQLEVTPTPVRRSDALDADGNSVIHVWFEDCTESLTIHSRVEAETLRDNPFDFLFLDHGHQRLPIVYDPRQAVVERWTQVTHPDAIEIDTLVREARRESGDCTVAFLTELNNMLHERIDVVVRDDGDPMSPVKTLEKERGACRDLAVLFNECCRRVGLAARFVSGYERGDDVQEERHLHAWSEVYLPGGGWRAFDPTHGLAVSDGHLAVAASGHAIGAAPVSGTFRGDGAEARMTSRLELSTERKSAPATAS